MSDDFVTHEATLKSVPEFAWLTDPSHDGYDNWYSPNKVAQYAPGPQWRVKIVDACEAGEVPGAFKDGKNWEIPRSGLVIYFGRRLRQPEKLIA